MTYGNPQFTRALTLEIMLLKLILACDPAGAIADPARFSDYLNRARRYLGVKDFSIAAGRVDYLEREFFNLVPECDPNWKPPEAKS